MSLKLQRRSFTPVDVYKRQAEITIGDLLSVVQFYFPGVRMNVEGFMPVNNTTMHFFIKIFAAVLHLSLIHIYGLYAEHLTDYVERYMVESGNIIGIQPGQRTEVGSGTCLLYTSSHAANGSSILPRVTKPSFLVMERRSVSYICFF